ncbi:MAG: hypothetical protein JKY94_01105 [Rhodobacteraceae bacterium]|nr:hypothetical protein [Paracoccaceae bacterium]
MTDTQKKPELIICHESLAASLKSDAGSFIALGASCAFAYWVEAGYVLQTAILAMWVLSTVSKLRGMLNNTALYSKCYTREEAQAVVSRVFDDQPEAQRLGQSQGWPFRCAWHLFIITRSKDNGR